MSLKKPIIKVTKKCKFCNGGTTREFLDVSPIGKHRWGNKRCGYCKGLGKIDIKKNNKNFKKYYIKNLEEVIVYWTRLYRNKNKEAQEYLGKVSEYSKELNKVVNK